MSRSAMRWMCLVVTLLVAACTKSPSDPSRPAPGKETGAAGATAVETLPEGQEAVPTTGLAADSQPDGAASPELTPPADEAAAESKLPFEDLVAALGDADANANYRRVEERLAQEPGNILLRMQRLLVLHCVGSALSAAGKKERGVEAYQATLEMARVLVEESEQELTPDMREVLSYVFYNGAGAEALSGRFEEAKAAMQRAIEMGFNRIELLRDDPELAALRELPDFDQQLAAWTQLIVELVVNSTEAFPFDFTLTDITGQPLNLDDYLDKVVIVDIWGTWCPPCKQEIPSFIKLQTEYGEQGFQMIGLNYERASDDAAKTEIVARFVQDSGINYPCALGTEEIRQQVPDFGVFPTTLFIDRAGKVRAKIVGMHEYTFLEAIVKFLLAEPAPTAAPAI